MSDDTDTLLPETETPVIPVSAGPNDRPPDAAKEGLPDRSAVSPLPDPPPPSAKALFGLRRGDRLFVSLLAGVALTLMGIHWLRLSGWGMRPVEIERQRSRTYHYKIDINTVGEAELVQLNGIGRTLAKRIIADRDRNGPFQTIDDLRRVRGIGPRKVETIRKWLSHSRDNDPHRAITP